MSAAKPGTDAKRVRVSSEVHERLEELKPLPSASFNDVIADALDQYDPPWRQQEA